MQRRLTGHLGLAFAVAAVAAVASCAHAPARTDRVAAASATIKNVAGAEVGVAQIWQDRDNVVHVDLQLSGLPPGPHAIHFHAVGQCDRSEATAFASAGGHYNPLGRQHGLDNSAGPHAGDAPNFTVSSDGQGNASFTTNRVSLLEGSTGLLDSDGSAIVVHVGADDQISQPAGNSGGRIACGVVSR